MLSLALTLSSCTTVEIPDIHPGITLPASGDGYQIGTLSHDEKQIPASEWAKKIPRGIVLFSDDWEKLKYVLLKNCLANECKQSVGALDGLFFAIDKALKDVAP